MSVTETSAWATPIPSFIQHKASDFPYSTGNVNLYASGHWTGTIQIPPNASAETAAKAELLQGYLERIGGPIDILTTTTGSGIKLGTYAEWLPYLSGSSDYLQNNSHDYILITRGGTLRIAAKDQVSLEQAIFRYLEILGYRQFFPTATWEDIPIARAFNANIGIQETSFIHNDKLLGGSGPNLESTQDLIDSWRIKNRIRFHTSLSDFQMWANQIILFPAYQNEFSCNSAYSSSVGYKLCVMEPRVREIVALRVKMQFDTHPDLLAWSVTATDGSLGWNEPCDNGGPISAGGTGENTMSATDRQVALANYVQEQLTGIGLNDVDYSTKHVAFLAYGDTSVKPTIYVNPKVFVTVATAFIMGGRTPEQVADDYRAMVEPGSGNALNIGYYGYLGTQLWGHGNPTAARMSQQTRWEGLYRQIMDVTQSSEFAYTEGESSSAWSIYGLGFYTFAKLLTPNATATADLATQMSQIKSDFLTRAFGPASELMGRFFDLITAHDGNQKLLTTDLLHKMYDHLHQARSLIDVTTDVVIKNRIDDLILYTRSQELWRLATREATGSPERFTAYDLLAKFIYRIRDTLMYDYYNFFYDPIFSSLKSPMLAKYAAEGLSTYAPQAVINADMPSWNSAAFSDTEIQDILTQGLTNNPLFPFTPVYYSMDELDVTTAFDDDPRGREGEGGDPDAFKAVYGDHDWYVKTKPGQTVLTITAKAGSGTPGAVNPKGPANIALYRLGQEGGAEEFVESVDIIADNSTQVVHDFTVQENTLYILRVTDPGVTVRLKWSQDDNKMSHAALEGLRFNLGNSVYYYFYVPKGTTHIGAYFGKSNCKVYRPDAAQTVAYTSVTAGEVVSIPVTDPTETGKIWKVYILGSSNGLQGTYLLNVPPQLARSPKELLIQKSLILQDNLQ